MFQALSILVQSLLRQHIKWKKKKKNPTLPVLYQHPSVVFPSLSRRMSVLSVRKLTLLLYKEAESFSHHEEPFSCYILQSPSIRLSVCTQASLTKYQILVNTAVVDIC